jgi:hypothetical protein
VVRFLEEGRNDLRVDSVRALSRVSGGGGGGSRERETRLHRLESKRLSRTSTSNSKLSRRS